jgi:hypothetical protein
MPEAFALRKFTWQFFGTLTFRSMSERMSKRKGLLFAWLRDIADSDGVRFGHLLWIARYEFGPTNNGHYHLCIAGLPPRVVSRKHCQIYEESWYRRAGFAQVALYDPARDGVGYVLKLPAREEKRSDCPPMLSESLFDTLRRGPM